MWEFIPVEGVGAVGVFLRRGHNILTVVVLGLAFIKQIELHFWECECTYIWRVREMEGRGGEEKDHLWLSTVFLVDFARLEYDQELRAHTCRMCVFETFHIIVLFEFWASLLMIYPPAPFRYF
jgi:hypothetical protein